jgi:uncharacterized protein YecE (DUF72 family)
MSVYIGCCGFPVGRREYYGRFRLVELQQTFYRPPRLQTARRWRQDAPAAFEFTLKASQFITHPAHSPTYRKAGIRIAAESAEHYGFFRPTEEVQAAWATTLQIAEALQSRIVVFQCPPSFTQAEDHVANLRRFFSTIMRHGLRFAWEPRGEWEDRLIASLCRDLDLIHCVDPLQRLPLYGEPAYFRLHGMGGYWYLYTREDLANLLKICHDQPEVYCLFNNVQMWQSAQEFQSETAA